MSRSDRIWTWVALVVWMALALAFDWPAIVMLAGAVVVIFTWRWRIPD